MGSRQVVPKLWGEERILVNEPEYCAKVLVLKKGAGSSWHRHPRKKETFLCLRGLVRLKVEALPDDRLPEGSLQITSSSWIMVPDSPGITIRPGQWHQFHGVEDSEILEVSTHDDPTDCERRTHSYGRGENPRAA